jgi:enoyl-CoA hydratase
MSLAVDPQAGCRHEASLFAAVCASEDKAEGTKAFLEKRKAEFKGK